MSTKLQPEAIINTLKNCFKWKNDDKIKASKLSLNIYCDFVKLRLVPKNNKATKAFINFQKDSNNLKFEGKLETWIEIGLDESNEEKLEELSKKTMKVDTFYEQYLNHEKSEKIKDEIEDEIIEDIDEIDDKKQSVTDKDSDLSKLPIFEKPIIVTWDFSKVAENALKHALHFEKILGGQIYLLNIAKKEKDIAKIEKDFETIIKDTYEKYKIQIKTIVKVGNIFKTITEIANQNEAKLVIMGTHGVKGIQKFTGSWALKVIAGTNTPFVVIHDKPVRDKVKNIAFAIDHTRENKQKLKQAKILAKNNNVKFYLTLPAEISNSQILRNTKTNLNYVKSYFKQNQIAFEVKPINGADTSVDATLKFIKENDIDLIVVLTTKNINIQDYVLGADEQRIIANDAKIPVMCINPNKVKYSSYSTFANS